MTIDIEKPPIYTCLILFDMDQFLPPHPFQGSSDALLSTAAVFDLIVTTKTEY